MNKSVEFLRGKKTYGVALVGGLYLLGCYVGWFEFDEKVCAGLGIGFVATFRSALNGIFPKGQVSSADGASVTLDPTAGNPNANATKTVSLIAFGLFIALAGQACAVLDKAAAGVTRAQVTTVTNTVVVTNLLPIAVSVPTPGETIFKTNFVDRVFTNTVIEARTNFVVKESIADTLQTAKVGAAVAGTFNPGAGALASAGLGILSAGLGLMAARKNKQAGESQKQLTAVISGVEEFTKGIDPGAGAKVKDAIAAASKELGVAGALHATVQDLTEAKI